MGVLSELIDKYPEDYRSEYEGPLLYIIRNHGNDYDRNNRSILGIFTSAELAQKAIIDAKNRQKRAGANVNMDVKVVIPNTSMYHGCSAYHINHLIEDPKSFEIVVRSWFRWKFILKHEQIL